MVRRVLRYILLTLVVLLNILILSTCAHDSFKQEPMDKLDEIVNKAIKKSSTPGISIAIVNDEESIIRSYGYADRKNEIEVTQNTLFELGSISKMFTGLAVLHLEQENKISLDDDITKYLPWFTFHYDGDKTKSKYYGDYEIKVKDLLNHTSGIPSQTIGLIPEGNSDDMLEQTVRALIGTKLDFYPGDKFSYATINYDVLGFLIQEISGQSYESYVEEYILEPLGLNNTHMLMDNAKSTGMMSKGYRSIFFSIQEFEPPQYRGNTPGGYIISDMEDMTRWMNILMGHIEIPEVYEKIIAKSFIPNTTVTPNNKNFYAVGWHVDIQGKSIHHGGSNPTFSGEIFIDYESGTGICILSNKNTDASGYIINSYLSDLKNELPNRYNKTIYEQADIVFSLVLIGSIVLGILFSVLLVLAVYDIIIAKRKRYNHKGIKVASILLFIPIITLFAFCLYYLPNILFYRLSWRVVDIWGSEIIKYSCISAFVGIFIFLCYVLLTFIYPKSNEKNYIVLVPLTFITGFSSALIMFVINESFNRNLEYTKELMIYFVSALVFHLYTSKLAQSRLIIITNEIIYKKRVKLISHIAGSSYESIEKVGNDRIYTGIVNDINVFGSIPSTVIGYASAALTLIFCLMYLLSFSVEAFLVSIIVIFFNVILSFFIGRSSSKYWEKNRDIQDVFFSHIRDLIYGFKEIVLSNKKKDDFLKYVDKYSKKSSDISKEVSFKLMNFDIYNVAVYNMIFGIVMFVFPILVATINTNTLRETMFIVFYLISPFNQVIQIFPYIEKIKVHINRINKLENDLEKGTVESSSNKRKLNMLTDLNIKFKDVKYTYMKHSENIDDIFTLGPLNIEIKTGTLTFVVGGNGSGKSTLSKLLTGLYSIHEGEILLNDIECSKTELNECFSAVFSDAYLFKKLYGIDVEEKKDELDTYLKKMKIDDKIKVSENGEFSSLALSAGQRKRIAYVVCCIENKPFILFDEWAAEQDPEFRHIFYTELLQELKQQGKGVVVITHDDRYFYLADQVIKLERGQML